MTADGCEVYTLHCTAAGFESNRKTFICGPLYYLYICRRCRCRHRCPPRRSGTTPTQTHHDTAY